MNEINMDMAMSNGDFSMFMYMGTGMIIFQVVYHLLTAWGLWNINKKLGEPHAWLSWIPVVNIYSYVRAAGKPNIWILWLILGAVALIIPIIGLIIFLVLMINVLHSISKRCGRGVWTTIGFIFIPFIMFPIVGYQLKESDIKKSSSTQNTTNEKKQEKSDSVEL